MSGLVGHAGLSSNTAAAAVGLSPQQLQHLSRNSSRQQLYDQPQQQQRQQQPMRQQQQDEGGPQLQLVAPPERGAAGLPSSPGGGRWYGRLGVRGSRDKERYLAPTGFL
jgi:hypothetical protein